MIVASVAWLQGTLLGTLATTAAIIAVASVGYMSLSGRLNIRHGATVILGCFVIFGASTIVAGIQSFVGGGSFTARELPPVAAVPQPPPLPPAPRSPDPYAGASVPSQ